MPLIRTAARAASLPFLAAMVIGDACAAAWASPVAYLQRTSSYWQAWVMDSDGSHARPVTTSSSEKIRVSWFPNGKSLLVCTESGELFAVDLATGREKKLPAPPLAEIVDAVLSPDGREVAFSAPPARSRDDHEIFLVSVDGTNLRQLTNEKRVQHQPAWHPLGNAVYYVSRTADDSHNIWRATLPGGDLAQLTVNHGLHSDVAARTDGAIAYSSNATGDYEIYVELPGEKPRALTSTPGVDGFPSWSPDGRELLFESSRTGQLEIWRVSVDGGEAAQLTRSPEGAQHPVFGPASARPAK